MDQDLGLSRPGLIVGIPLATGVVTARPVRSPVTGVGLARWTRGG